MLIANEVRKMRNVVCFLFMALSVSIGNAQNRPDQLNLRLKTGDLLFCRTTAGDLSKAIDQVTQTGKETHYSHVGIIDIRNDTIWVLHSAPEKGVCCEVLSSFLNPENEKRIATAYRLKSKNSKAIPAAIQKARELIGQHYNFTYIFKDQGYYCSEYIYELFAADSIFTLNPMTFKNPKTGQFIPEWIDHYQKLGIAIPEGEPGCNPNGMAASEKLEMIGEVKFAEKD